MKKISILTISALCLFGIATQTAFGQSSQGDQNKHNKKDHSGQSEHSNKGHDNRGPAHSQAAKHSTRTVAPKRSVSRKVAPNVESRSNNHSRSFTREVAPNVQSRSNNHSRSVSRKVAPNVQSRSNNHSRSFTREVAPNVQSRSNNHSWQNRERGNSDRNVRINTERSSRHSNRFSVSHTQYNTFISSGWRHHHGWDRDDSGNFFYNRHRIFFSLISGFYYPYYLNAGAPVYISYSANGGGTVASVQQALQQAGYYQGAVDGEFGPMTSRAIANYQNDQGLAPTGRINDALINSLGLN